MSKVLTSPELAHPVPSCLLLRVQERMSKLRRRVRSLLPHPVPPDLRACGYRVSKLLTSPELAHPVLSCLLSRVQDEQAPEASGACPPCKRRPGRA